MGKHGVTRKKRSQMRKYKKKSRRQGGFFGCTGASCSAGVAEEPGRANKPYDSVASAEAARKSPHLIIRQQQANLNAQEAAHNKRTKNMLAGIKAEQEKRKEAIARFIALTNEHNKALAERKPPQLSLSNIPTKTFSR